MNRRLIENTGVVMGIPAQALSTAAVDGDWAKMSLHGRVAIVLNIGAITATCAVTLNQALTNAGGSEKALSIVRAWLSAANSDVFTAATITSGAITIAATDDNKTLVIEVEPNDLDIENNFIWLQLVLGSTTASVAAIYLMRDPKYTGAVDAQLSALS